MPKPGSLERIDRPEDVGMLNATLDDLYAEVETPYKQFVPTSAPKEPRQVTLYFDEDAQKFKFVKADGTTETIESS